ncbi:MAG TPA: ABC transporter permease [Patescibacteria group bacterium]|jgi:ABC-2 type transport system permease protein|nr:ABC transporter permease [Patescibacteria group bacterium]
MINAYWQVVKTSAHEDAANAKRLIAGVSVSVIRIGLIAAIYGVAYRKLNHASLPYANAIWGIGIYFGLILNLGLRNVFKIVNHEVSTGMVEVGLIKPLDWRLTKVCQLIGKNGLEFLVGLVAIPCALYMFVGLPDTSHISIVVVLSFILLTILAIVAAASLFLTIGLSAFWLNDAKSVYRLTDKVVLIFGGGFVPIALLPGVVQSIIRYSPFGVYAAPTQLFNPAMVANLPATLISAVVWSVLLLVFCQFIWARVEKRIEVNGG